MQNTTVPACLEQRWWIPATPVQYPGDLICSNRYTHKQVGHIFGTNFGKCTHTFVTRLRRRSIHTHKSWSHFWDKFWNIYTYICHTVLSYSRTVDTKQTPPANTNLYVGFTRHDSRSAASLCNTRLIKHDTAMSSSGDA